MARRGSGGAEIIGRVYQAATEQVQPDAVDVDPCGEWVVGRCHPLGEFEPPAAFSHARRFRVHDLQYAPRDDRARLLHFAANVNRAVVRTVAFPRAHRQHLRRAVFFIQVELRTIDRNRSKGEDVANRIGLLPHRFLYVGDLFFNARTVVFAERFEHVWCGTFWQAHQRRGVVRLHEPHGAVASLGAAENPGECVIVLHRDRVELVIVAPRAGRRRAEEREAESINLLIDDVHFVLESIPFIQRFRADGKEPRGNRLLCFGSIVLSGKQIARELLLREPVEWDIRIERGNHVVAVPPSVRKIEVHGLARTLRIACDIEPVSTPAFAVMRRCQQAIDERFQCLRRLVVRVRRCLFRRRRQPDEVEIHAANQRCGIGRFHWLQLLRFESREHVAVEVRLRPRRIANRRQRRDFRRLIRPELPPLLDVDLNFRALGHAVARVGRAHIHPRLEVRNHRIGQSLLRWHLAIFVFGFKCIDEQTFRRLPRHDRRTAIAAQPQPVPRIERQSAANLLRIGGMALVTLLDENGANLLLEEVQLLLRRHVRRTQRHSSSHDDERSNSDSHGKCLWHKRSVSILNAQRTKELPDFIQMFKFHRLESPATTVAGRFLHNESMRYSQNRNDHETSTTRQQ